MAVIRGRGVAAGRHWKRIGQRVPLRAYVVGLVVLFAAVAAVNVVYQRPASLRDARQEALASAGFAALTAADAGGQRASAAKDHRGEEGIKLIASLLPAGRTASAPGHQRRARAAGNPS